MKSFLNNLVHLFVFIGNALHIGDHIPWHRPFDDTEDTSSKIQHILVTKDPQLPDISGPYGTLDFRQVRDI